MARHLCDEHFERVAVGKPSVLKGERSAAGGHRGVPEAHVEVGVPRVLRRHHLLDGNPREPLEQGIPQLVVLPDAADTDLARHVLVLDGHEGGLHGLVALLPNEGGPSGIEATEIRGSRQAVAKLIHGVEHGHHRAALREELQAEGEGASGHVGVADDLVEVLVVRILLELRGLPFPVQGPLDRCSGFVGTGASEAELPWYVLVLDRAHD
mmetsp:Transcript_111659/g.320787  ORF Transcript_111659/g.320787 Transcript_111659/m.320787 type:complete len:210 (+) Transcript_111659:234-863(+)